MKITSIKKVQSEPVYDFTVKVAHHYILENGVITHNSGLEYAASTILFLSKKKDKQLDDDDGRTGAVITAHTKKARLTIEDKKVETWLNYSEGLDQYYGLLGLAEKFDIIKKVSTRYEFPNGDKAFESQIKKHPEKYFTPEILTAIDDACKNEFLYGKTNVMNVEESV
jgi:hypothetical protein